MLVAIISFKFLVIAFMATRILVVQQAYAFTTQVRVLERKKAQEVGE